MTLLNTIENTPVNHRGLCFISLNRSYLAYPGCNTSGKIHLYYTSTNINIGFIVAHINPIATMNIDQSAKK